MDTIPFSHFQKLDIRIGTIVDVSIPEGSNKLYRLTVDLGEELGKKTVFAGIKNYYETDELAGRQVVILANLEPKEFFKEMGEGMLLAVDEEDKPILLQPEKKVKNGSIIR
jgi:methionine--tRNA ligase beta chain